MIKFILGLLLLAPLSFSQDTGVAVSRFGAVYEMDLINSNLILKATLTEKLGDVTTTPTGDIYTIGDITKSIYKISTANPAWTVSVVSMINSVGEVGGIAFNIQENCLYYTAKTGFSATSKLYKFDFVTLQETYVGDTNSGNILSMDFASDGSLWGFDRGLAFPFPGIVKIDHSNAATNVMTPPGTIYNLLPGNFYFASNGDMILADTYLVKIGTDFITQTDLGIYFFVDNFELQGMDTLNTSIGTPYCNAVPNSTGSYAETLMYGSASILDNNLALIGTNIPQGELALLLVSKNSGFTPFPGGSLGYLCLYGYIGRAPILTASNNGMVYNLIQPTLPLSAYPYSYILPGETIYFQYWYTDGVDSNFSYPTYCIFN